MGTWVDMIKRMAPDDTQEVSCEYPQIIQTLAIIEAIEESADRVVKAISDSTKISTLK